MHTGETLFSRTEVEQVLEQAGFSRGTDEFNDELKRRFTPAEGYPGKYVEQ